MSLFTQIPYHLETLIRNIDSGILALPEIQRPFVWENAKVRDLLDSMYRGYPVGALLFWLTSENPPVKRGIGQNSQQTVPHSLIVDGQQRLTGLYAVIKGVPVLRNNYEYERIRIAFNPLTGEFMVPDASTPKDPAFIADISEIWSPDADLFSIVPDYMARYRAARGENSLAPEDEKDVKEALKRLHALPNTYTFTVLQLVPQMTEEEVSQVFVRVNSTGKRLNQADFILTLMSVYWDEGRHNLERFARESRIPPPSGQKSPFNFQFRPEPDHLLRVGVALAFRRARLQHVYSVLRGKDMETDKFSDERREEQFAKLQAAQAEVLNSAHWFEFLACLMQAGYRREELIISGMAAIYSYAFFLLGKCVYTVPQPILRKAIARWFFASALTARYSSSPETVMEKDMAALRDVTTAQKFADYLENQMALTLTTDYWNITLPGNMASSAARSPELAAYFAALNLLDARVLFSKVKVSELMDPGLQPRRSLLERHHLFPKAHLKKIGFGTTRQTNQIANMALLEWPQNIHIKDDAPGDYFPRIMGNGAFTEQEWQNFARWHALPEAWETMDYDAFLPARRKLMAQVIRDGFEKI
ncbi:MAG: DUF262 domain-containing protein [Desulfovibrio sp.]|jgi:hypothetical protein|nr:DUF262 domain-containing protein [Desulfovibrio sp.]